MFLYNWRYILIQNKNSIGDPLNFPETQSNEPHGAQKGNINEYNHFNGRKMMKKILKSAVKQHDRLFLVNPHILYATR